MPSDPNPAQPDGGMDNCRSCGSPMCCGAPNFGAPILPASPEREAAYRAVDRVIELRAGLYTLPVKIDFVARHDANEALKYAIDVAAAQIARKEPSNAE